ncbi:uncharacterized protein [Procambarus clarkii]|uniref:uncharacterized protein isoform X2 n=1 Tax=Procambarus clarkii TaxID=6728 RepID=UPI003742D629
MAVRAPSAGSLFSLYQYQSLPSLLHQPELLRGPRRVVRLCVFALVLPALLITIPLYVRLVLYPPGHYPMVPTDQRLLSRHVSSVWCQAQKAHMNGTFNGYLSRSAPGVDPQRRTHVMLHSLALRDDVKEYWGFFLLKGSTVTLSSCSRWDGGQLMVLRGAENLHRCAWIGEEDSAEEEEEEDDVASNERHELQRHNMPGFTAPQEHSLTDNRKSGIADDTSHSSVPLFSEERRQSISELLRKAIKISKDKTEILRILHTEGKTRNFAFENQITDKDLALQNNTDNSTHVVPEIVALVDGQTETDANNSRKNISEIRQSVPSVETLPGGTLPGGTLPGGTHPGGTLPGGTLPGGTLPGGTHPGGTLPGGTLPGGTLPGGTHPGGTLPGGTLPGGTHPGGTLPGGTHPGGTLPGGTLPGGTLPGGTLPGGTLPGGTHPGGTLPGGTLPGGTHPGQLRKARRKLKVKRKKGKRKRLNDKLNKKGMSRDENNTEELLVEDENTRRSRFKRFADDEEDTGNGAFEELDSNDLLDTNTEADLNKRKIDRLKEEQAIGHIFFPEGVKFERGRFNQSTVNDNSREEHRSSYSSSEEALASCEGVILTLPLLPYRSCSYQTVDINKIVYDIPVTGTYYFVFSSDNEIYVNDLFFNLTMERVVYDVKNSEELCLNTTECSMPLRFWSDEQAVVEVPQEAGWDNSYVLETKCEPRVYIYLTMILLVPVLIMCCAFH